MREVLFADDVRSLLMDEHPDVELQDRFWDEFWNVLRVIAVRWTGDARNAGDFQGLVWIWAFERPDQVARAYNKARWGGVHLRLRNAQRRLKRPPEVVDSDAVGRRMVLL